VVAKQADDSAARALVRAAQAGDPDAFRRLVETYMRAVHGIAYRMMGNHDDADDVAQETFVRAHRALDRYDETYSFYTWLRTIATRVALNEIEKRKRRHTQGGEAFETAAEVVASPAPDPSEQLALQQLSEALQAALQKLPGEYRSVLALRTYEQMSYEEIATTLEIPIGTVMSRLNRARGLLREAWRGRLGSAIEPKERKQGP
jgi:RNA polymerase sigma-70 factor (ECF subfamily)